MGQENSRAVDKGCPGLDPGEGKGGVRAQREAEITCCRHVLFAVRRTPLLSQGCGEGHREQHGVIARGQVAYLKKSTPQVYEEQKKQGPPLSLPTSYP